MVPSNMVCFLLGYSFPFLVSPLMPFATYLLILLSILPCAASADAANPAHVLEMPYDYHIVPGDILEITVWREDGMNQKVLVRPDGGISVQLIGTVAAAGLTVEQLTDEIAARLSRFLTAPAVTVSLLTSNQKIYVLGKVNKPGEIPMLKRVTVMQALAIAGGLAPFADRDDIAILRRSGKENLHFPFDYDSVRDGEKQEQNLLLQDGDVVVVP